jgi:hypothetical protein
MSMLTGNRDKIKARKRGQKPTDSRFVLKAGLTSLGCFSPKRRFENQKTSKTKKQALCFNLFFGLFVLKAGIEPARREALDFESNVSTNSTT